MFKEGNGRKRSTRETFHNKIESLHGPYTNDSKDFLGASGLLIVTEQPMIIGSEVWIEVTEKNE